MRNEKRAHGARLSMDIRDLVLNNLKIYDSIKPKNPTDSFTVLATLNDSDTGELLCLATGTQANLRSYDDDIQDCHAESLLKRAYKRYVIETIEHELDKASAGTLDRHSKEFLVSQLPKNVTLFVTKFPCGFLTRYAGREPVDPETGQIIKRKPGRGTERGGKMIFVEKDSCFVKLQKWLKDGFQGRRLRQVFSLETSIKMIIVGNCESADDFDYMTHVRQLEAGLIADHCGIDIRHVDCARRSEFIFRPDAKPQPVSIVWWRRTVHGILPPASPNNNCEMIVDGRRRGLTRNHCSSGQIETSARLKVADTHLRRDLERILSIYTGCPNELKPP